VSHHYVELLDLHFTYPDGKQALNGISFRIGHGESVAIVGANGAGKSTLMMMLAGVLLPGKGEVRVGDTPVTQKTLPYIRQRIGLVFQDPDDQLFMGTVYEDVAFGPRNYGLDEKAVEKRVLKALEMVGALHLKDRPPYKLSGGEKRVVSIAAVLSMEPDILAMDEPTASLDPRSRRRLINLLKDFTHTKIIATHDLDMVLELCERVIVLKEGRFLHDGKPAEVLSNEDILEEAGLEKPFALQNCPVCGRAKQGASS